jgi:type II secretion system protein H
VLTLLAIAAALIAPALSHFMRGRALDAEARRLLSLTRAAQSRAVSEGLPVLLWLDAAQAAYGTEEEMKPGAADPKALQFTLDDSVRMTVPNAAPAVTQKRHLPAIRFLPDGGVDEASPAAVRLNDASGVTLILAQTRNRMGYEIQHANP